MHPLHFVTRSFARFTRVLRLGDALYQGATSVTQSSPRRTALLLSSLCVLAACGSNTSSNQASKWIGKTYLLDTPNIPVANWTKPKDIGQGVGSYVPQFFINVAAGSGSDLQITLATGYDGKQDLCSVTTQLTASGASYPNIQIGASAVPMRIVETNPTRAKTVPTTIHDLVLKNILPSDTDATDGELDATVDIAELYPLFYLVPDPRNKDTVCATFESNSSGKVTCQTCSFNSQPYCLGLTAVQIGASETSTTVQKVSTSDIGSSCN
jgi:hypothetical protein